MKKRFKYFGLVMVLSVFGFMVIGSGSDSTSDKSGTKEIVSTTEEVGESTVSTDSNDDSTDDNITASSSVSVEEQLLVEKEGLKITAKEYVTDSFWGEGLKLLLENDSENNLGVGCKAVIVNDYMITDLFSGSIAAGKKSNETLYLSSTELKEAGIENVGKVDIYFYVFNPDTYETLYECDPVTIQTSEYATMDITSADAGQELYNENGIKIVGKYVDDNSFWGAAVLLYIENKSGKNVIVQADNMSINGFMVTPYFSSDIYDGKMSISDITLMSSELEENGIESVDDIELSFKIFDENYNNISTTDPISFSAK